MSKPELEFPDPFKIEALASQSYILAAAMMANPRSCGSLSYSPKSHTSELSPNQLIYNTLEVWDRRKSPDNIASHATDTNIFTAEESHLLGCLAWSCVQDESAGRYLALNLAGFAAMPRIIAADRYLQQKNQLVASLKAQGLSPDDEHTFVGSLAVTPAELIADIPWSMDAVPDLFSFSERKIGECARLFMGRVATYSRIYETINQGDGAIQPNFVPDILRSALFRSLVRNSLQEGLGPETAAPAIDTLTVTARQVPSLERTGVGTQDSFEPYLPRATATLIANMVKNCEGELPILRGANFGKEQASAVLHAHVQLCATYLLAHYSRSFKPSQSSVLGGEEHRDRYLEGLPVDAKIRDMHMVVEPFTADHKKQFPNVPFLKESMVLSFLSRVQTAECQTTQYQAKSYALYVTQQGRGPIRLRVRQSVSNLSQKSIYKMFADFIAAQTGPS